MKKMSLFFTFTALVLLSAFSCRRPSEKDPDPQTLPLTGEVTSLSPLNASFFTAERHFTKTMNFDGPDYSIKTLIQGRIQLTPVDKKSLRMTFLIDTATKSILKKYGFDQQIATEPEAKAVFANFPCSLLLNLETLTVSEKAGFDKLLEKIESTAKSKDQEDFFVAVISSLAEQPHWYFLPVPFALQDLQVHLPTDRWEVSKKIRNVGKVALKQEFVGWTNKADGHHGVFRSETAQTAPENGGLTTAANATQWLIVRADWKKIETSYVNQVKEASAGAPEDERAYSSILKVEML
jgi:hypothetical protein